MNLEAVIDVLKGLVVDLDGKLPAVDIQNAREMIDAWEPGIALENLCTQLYEYGVAVPRHVLVRIIVAGEAMRLVPALWADLAAEP